MSNTAALLRTVKSSGQIARSVQTVSIANSPYSEHMPSVHLIITSGHTITYRTIRTILTDRNGPYASCIDTERINSSLYKLYEP